MVLGSGIREKPIPDPGVKKAPDPGIIELFTKKIVKKLFKIWFWDPGSGKNLFRITDPGVKKATDPGSATLICESVRS